MAKKTVYHTYDKKTKTATLHQETRGQKAGSAEMIGWSKGPGKNPLKKAARALWG